MPSNPLSDSLVFLAGGTPNHTLLGFGGMVMAGVYLALLAASVAVAILAVAGDRQQLRVSHLARWLVRLLVGTMWFQGSLWKLPLPVSGGLQFWTSEMAKYSAFPWHQALVQDVMLPNLWLLGLPSFIVEFGLATLLMLGLGVRLAGIGMALWTANLWIGLYNHPTEWPWTYGFIMMLGVLLAADHAGRSLGLDAMMDRPRFRRSGLVGTIWRLAA